jgi:hypothetical protein
MRLGEEARSLGGVLHLPHVELGQHQGRVIEPEG